MKNELNDQLKNALKEAKTKEELDVLVSQAGMELSDDELDAVAGGRRFPSGNVILCDTKCP